MEKCLQMVLVIGPVKIFSFFESDKCPYSSLIAARNINIAHVTNAKDLALIMLMEHSLFANRETDGKD